MPIIGTIASSRRAGSSMELIQNTTLGATQNGITFSTIPQTFTHLKLVCNIKGVGTSFQYGHIYLRFNGNSVSTSYGGLKNQAFNVDWTSSISAFGSYPADTLDVGYYIDNASGLTNMFGPLVIDIPNYTNTTFNKNTTSMYGFYANNSNSGQDRATTGFGSGSFFNTGAISEILINNYGSQFITGTTVSLYGIRG